MKALVICGPAAASVQEVEPPHAGAGEVVVTVQRAGVCGTDIEFYTGQMPYLHDGSVTFPVRIGHEWMGTVTAVGDGVDRHWLGRRVTGDTMLGCGHCGRCAAGKHHVCTDRAELGIRNRPGALAEQVAVPVTSLRQLPDAVDDTAGALVEPGGNAWRAVAATGLAPGASVLIVGTGTIGLLSAMFARAAGLQPHLFGNEPDSVAFAKTLGFAGVYTATELPDRRWDSVIDASTAADIPARAVEFVEPAGRVVYIGISGTPSLLDTRALVLGDITAVGILSASPGLTPSIEAYASGAVDPHPIVAATLTLEQMPAVLAGNRPVGAGPGPKFLVRM